MFWIWFFTEKVSDGKSIFLKLTKQIPGEPKLLKNCAGKEQNLAFTIFLDVILLWLLKNSVSPILNSWW